MSIPPIISHLSILIPPPEKRSAGWLHQAPGDEHEFASNASLIPPPVGPYVLLTTPERITKPYNPTDDGRPSCGSGSGRREDEKKITQSMNANSLRVPGAIRGRKFHEDQPYPHTLSRLLADATPFDLPPPTSPIRSRRAKLGLTIAWRWHPWPWLSRLLVHPTAYLALYFTLNLSLTLYNKLLLISFPFPYTLSALHALCGSIGSLVLARIGSTPVPKLNSQETLVLLAFSALYTVNIIVSNVSLGLVTVPFHQVVRAATPLFTILFSALILGTRSSRMKLVALLPVVLGVGFATYGDYYFTPWGCILTLLGTVLASLKTIYTNFLQVSAPPPHTHLRPSDPIPAFPIPTSLRNATLPPLTPLHLLYLLSPLAFLQSTLLAQYTGELERVQEYLLHPPQIQSNIFARTLPSSGPRASLQLFILLINGFLAFGLNVVSFSANRKIGALSMTVAGEHSLPPSPRSPILPEQVTDSFIIAPPANVKQVLTILCAVALFNLTITPMNAIGIVLTLFGGAAYASVELREKREKAAASLQ
ncbi:hypothetical protein H0H87_010576 [Tephrocybe sp. NHM501043]|nr:hypothetical protein H0H87_010576 [Tephrocybe sp. NHM501043]